MWNYVIRRILYNVPVYLGIILLMMIALRINDPIWGFLGKSPTQEMYDAFAAKSGLDQPFIVQYFDFVWDVFRLDFDVESWDKPGLSVGGMLVLILLPK